MVPKLTFLSILKISTVIKTQFSRTFKRRHYQSGNCWVKSSMQAGDELDDLNRFL